MGPDLFVAEHFPLTAAQQRESAKRFLLSSLRLLDDPAYLCGRMTALALQRDMLFVDVGTYLGLSFDQLIRLSACKVPADGPAVEALLAWLPTMDRAAFMVLLATPHPEESHGLKA